MRLRFAQFESRLAKTGPEPAYVFNGRESFYVERSLRLLAGACLDGDLASPSLSELSGTSSEAEVFGQLKTFPFLARRRLVVVRDAPDFANAHKDALLAYLKAPSETSTLALYGRFDGRQSATRALSKKLPFVACHPPDDRDMPRWLRDHAKGAYGLRLEVRAASLLADLIGPQLGRADRELGKLAALAGSKKRVDENMVGEAVLAVQGVKIFGVLDAALDGPPSRALGEYGQLVARGFKGSRGNSGSADPNAILMPFFTMLSRDLLLIQRLRAELDAGRRPTADQMGVKDFPFKKAMGRARSRDAARLRRDLAALAEADRRLKSSHDPVLTVERLVLQLSHR